MQKIQTKIHYPATCWFVLQKIFSFGIGGYTIISLISCLVIYHNITECLDWKRATTVNKYTS